MADTNKEKDLKTTEENLEENLEENKEQETIEREEARESEDELKKLQKEIEDMKNLAQRTQADFINYKRRVEKEKSDLIALANENIMTDMLDILDNFERALESEKDSTESPFYKGVQMIFKQLKDSLEKFDLQEIEAENKEFDPNLHHAVMQEDGENPGCVLEVLQKGYKLKNKVIRPTMVKVCK